MMKILTMQIIILGCSVAASAQKMDSTLRMSIQGGVGWMHYYNSLKIQGNSVTSDYIGTSVRLMWEPEHRLSLGVESGYYTLYTVKLNSGDGDVRLSIIPVLANIKMRILPNLFITGGTGIVIMNSELRSTPDKSTNSTVISFSNVQVSGLYIYKLTPQFGVGGELKFMWLDKTDDFMHSLQAVVSYRF